MQASVPAFNPFSLIIDPEAVSAALKRAEEWHLRSRVCNPLDRPSRVTLPRELQRHDDEIDRAED